LVTDAWALDRGVAPGAAASRGPEATRRPAALGGLLATLCIAALALPQAAAAHAELISTSPERGAQVEAAPERVALRFNEPVEGGFGAVRVFDAEGERVDEGELLRPGGDSEAVGVALPTDLPEGSYTATYRVISADSHPISGGFVFNVGKGGAAPAATVAELIDEGAAGPATSVAFGAVRGLAYLAIALAVGGVIFLAAVWLPGLRAASGAGPEWASASEAFAARFGRLAAATVGLGVLTTAFGIVLQGANAGGTSFWTALDPTVVGDVLGTRFGTIWGFRLLDWLLLGALAVAAVVGARLPALRPASLGAAGLAARPLGSWPVLLLLALLLGFLVVSPGLSGHAGTTEPELLVMTSDTLHVLAMSAWMGGLLALLVVLPAATRRLEAPDRTRLLAACLRRFSPLALASVAVLLASGAYQSILYLESLGDLIGSAFGRAILIKIGLIIVLIRLGALNLRRNRPELDRLAAEGAPAGGAGRLLRRAVQAEVALIAVVLGVTAALTSYPPPGAEAAGPFNASAELGPAQLDVTVDPAATGANEIHLYLFDARDGSQWDRARELTVRLHLPERDIGPLEPRVDKAGPGHYVARRALISPGGDWQLHFRALVSDFEEHRAVIEVPVE
jgi:copper transport protein